jgi:hypothetical protein
MIYPSLMVVSDIDLKLYDVFSWKCLNLFRASKPTVQKPQNSVNTQRRNFPSSRSTRSPISYSSLIEGQAPTGQTFDLFISSHRIESLGGVLRGTR